jgi:nucleoside-diphosphate-sugar epimerase
VPLLLFCQIASGVLASPGKAPGTYNLGTGCGTSLNELAALLTSRINPSLLPQYAPAPAGELRYSIANITAAQRALGFEPQRTLSSDIDGVIADIAQRQRTRR